MQLCVHCKHHRHGNHGLDGCHSPNNRVIRDVVRGDRREVTLCMDQRAVMRGFDVLNGRCGKRARWFEPKEPK